MLIIKQLLPSLLRPALLLFVLPGLVNAQQDTVTFKGRVGKTLKDSKEWWPEKPRAPKGAPNVLIYLIDDAGYGTSGLQKASQGKQWFLK